jgi:hypothetical protein
MRPRTGRLAPAPQAADAVPPRALLIPSCLALLTQACCLKIVGAASLVDGGVPMPPRNGADSGVPVCSTTRFQFPPCVTQSDCPAEQPECVGFLQGVGPPSLVYDSGVFPIRHLGTMCCAPPLAQCNACNPCCWGGCLADGTCGGSLPAGAGCLNDEGCGPGMLCERPLFNYGTFLGCCLNIKQPCDTGVQSYTRVYGDSPDCCTGHCGVDGLCACVPTGKLCTPWTPDGGCCSGACGVGDMCQ